MEKDKNEEIVNNLKKEEIIKFFEEKANSNFEEYEKSREIEDKTYDILDAYFSDKSTSVYRNDVLEQYFNNLLDNKEHLNIDNISDSTKDKILFQSFFLMSTLYRRRLDTPDLHFLIDKHEHKFKDYTSFKFAKNLLDKSDNSNLNLDLIESSKEIYESNRENVGYAHNYIETICQVYEYNNDLRLENDLVTYKNSIRKLLDIEDIETLDEHNPFKEELEIISTIIKLKDYAKFYCTKGRLLGILGRYHEGANEIMKALKSEDSTKDDYSIRISQYNNSLNNLNYLKLEDALHYATVNFENITQESEDNLQKQGESINTKLQEQEEYFDEKINESLSKNMEYLGIFLAVVSFTLGSFSTVNSYSYQESGKLLVILFMSIVLAYSWIIILIRPNKNKSMNIISIILSLFIITILLV